MRQRITFLQEPQNSIDPQNIKVDKNSITAKRVRAAREDRVTFSFTELPQDLYRVLKGSQKLHIRWVKPRQYETTSPLSSRLSPGLHVFYSPQRNGKSKSKSPDLLCPALKKVFGQLDCVSPEVSFTKLSMENSPSNTTLQYYQHLENLSDLVEYMQHKICKASDEECVSRVNNILDASSVDIDFDTTSYALNIVAYWEPRKWDIGITNSGPKDSVEVGILSIEESLKPEEEVSLAGFLTVLGKDSKPSPTLFAFPARHHSADGIFFMTSMSSYGLHPSLHLTLDTRSPNTYAPSLSDRKCSLHAHLTLPHTTFADKYQLSDPLFLLSKNLKALHHVTSPVDLEAPDYAMEMWGSSLLLELAPPELNKKFVAEIPLHLRYLPPMNNTDGIATIQIPHPAVFWACTADEESKLSVNPFDRISLGYDGLFGPQTMFYHVSPLSIDGRMMTQLRVPVLDLNKSSWVELGTVSVVLLGFLWIVWCLFGVWRKGKSSKGGKLDTKKEQ
ncbi:protease B nonderepressible form [Ciborinia camelliae]|nr:protease B nonderepressible form [Ciborinia camelliae]